MVHKVLLWSGFGMCLARLQLLRRLSKQYTMILSLILWTDLPIEGNYQPVDQTLANMHPFFYTRCRCTVMAIGHRDAALVKHFVSLGVSYLCGRRRWLRLLAHGRRGATDCIPGREASSPFGETEEEGRKRRKAPWRRPIRMSGASCQGENGWVRRSRRMRDPKVVVQMRITSLCGAALLMGLH